MIEKKARRGTMSAPAPRRFVVVNKQLHYFCGFHKGGQTLWLDDYSRAKKLDDERKFLSLQKICREELAMGWCDEGAGPARGRRKQG
jgi:hypothetical protein